MSWSSSPWLRPGWPCLSRTPCLGFSPGCLVLAELGSAWPLAWALLSIIRIRYYVAAQRQALLAGRRQRERASKSAALGPEPARVRRGEGLVQGAYAASRNWRDLDYAVSARSENSGLEPTRGLHRLLCGRPTRVPAAVIAPMHPRRHGGPARGWSSERRPGSMRPGRHRGAEREPVGGIRGTRADDAADDARGWAESSPGDFEKSLWSSNPKAADERGMAPGRTPCAGADPGHADPRVPGGYRRVPLYAVEGTV